MVTRPDLILEARAWVDGRFDDVEIGIDLETGRILAVKRNLPGTPRRRHRGILVPSAVDLHVHFRDPGQPRKEDFKTGTRGAALGGVGAVLDMPNTHPLVDRASRLREKRETVAAKACVDWGLWATLTSQTPDPARLLRDAHGVKLFLAPTTDTGPSPDDAQVAAALRAAATHDRLTVLHAETLHDGPPPADLAHHDAQRPLEGEVEAIQRAQRAAPEPGLVHVAHATTREAVDAAHAAGFTAATTPHHLLLAYNEGHLGTRGRVNPPLRRHEHRDALWQHLADGHVPLIETDHAPHSIDEKARPFPEAPSGIPNIETAYPLLLHQARTRHVDLGRIIAAFAEAPAARLGLPKGRIAAGYDADLAHFDPREPAPIRGADLQSPSGWTPFEGWTAYRIDAHYLHGELVVEDHQYIGRPGHGRPLPIPSARAATQAWQQRAPTSTPPEGTP